MTKPESKKIKVVWEIRQEKQFLSVVREAQGVMKEVSKKLELIERQKNVDDYLQWKMT